MNFLKVASLVALLIAASCARESSTDGHFEDSKTEPEDQEKPVPETIQIRASDGALVFGTKYNALLDESAPLVHLFHQGGSNGRGEYGPLIEWINENGFHAIAWDLRSGGHTYGESNRTASSIGKLPAGYCDAYPDMEAAIRSQSIDGSRAKTFVWGSSYSAALVFQVAAKNAGLIDGVVAFSPAAGEPLAECRARDFLEDHQVPAFVLKPDSEMERESSLEQREIFKDARVKFQTINNGVHGSSMLIDERTGHNMSSDRSMVMEWMQQIMNKDA